MQRRKFIQSSFKTLCLTYLSSQFAPLITSDKKRLRKPHQKTLFAFIDAVVPGCDIQNINHLAGFYDETLPISKYLRILIFRINRITKKLKYKKKFHALDRADRIKIIAHGYHHSSLDKDLFHGAIYLSQVAVYGGIFNENTNSDFIQFEGSGALEPHQSTWHYTDMAGLESPLTVDGNYH